MPSTLAEIVASPSLTALTFPFSSTVTTFVLEDAQMIDSRRVASGGEMIAASVDISPTIIFISLLFKVIFAIEECTST